MKRRRYGRVLLAESVREFSANRAGAAASVVIVATAFLVVAFTYGRAVTAASDAAAALDSVGTRTVIMLLDPNLEVPLSQVAPVATLSSVEQVLFLGPARDAVNAYVPGEAVGLRDCYDLPRQVLCRGAAEQTVPPRASTSAETLAALGFSGSIGAVVDRGGNSLVVRPSSSPLLADDGPLATTALAPAVPQPNSRVALVVVVVANPHGVSQTVGLLERLAGDLDPTKISIESHLDVIQARARVSEALLDAGRLQAVGVMALAATMLAFSEFAQARTRRRFAGLRRALGASRLQIAGIATLCAEFGALAGTTLGLVASAALAAAAVATAPPLRFLAALAIALQLVAVAASTLPAVYMATRDPATELRVP